MNYRIKIRKLVRMAALTAIALVIFIIEAQIPVPLPIPGLKLGFANIVTLYVLFAGRGGEYGAGSYSAADALMILLSRIILGAVFTGRVTAFIYSLTGGLLSFAAMLLIRRFVTRKQIWVCGVFGAVFHNAGQIAAAAVITGTLSVAAFLPVLTAAGIVTGVFTGLAAQFTGERLSYFS